MKTNGNALTTRTAWGHPLDLVRRDMDTLFDRFFGGLPALLNGPHGSHAAWGLDVQDEETEVVVRADLPGFAEDELDVQVHQDVLTIKAETKQEGDGRRSYRRYHQSVTLPAGVNTEGAQAAYRNGVLELRLPKTPEAQPRRIPVRPTTPRAIESEADETTSA